MSLDAIDLAVFKHAFHSAAEEMGQVLRQTAFSPNIKERRDYSTAVFDADGNVIAMGDHMPVHLGSMPMSVFSVLNNLELHPGDIAILNDPYAGGTHLPDITLVMPVHPDNEASAAFYVASRAHHADVGGMYPGSMGPCREIFQEGLRIPPIKLACKGEISQELLRLLLANVRTPDERYGDLMAQAGACRIGVERIRELINQHGLAKLNRGVSALLNHADTLMRSVVATLPAGEFEAADFLDGGVKIRVVISCNPAAATIGFDFSGSSNQIDIGLNAVAAITHSAVFYLMRCLAPREAASSAGLMRAVTIRLPEASIVNARPPAAVAGGNVETSQRIVDTILLAFSQMLPERIPAASCGTMSNVTIGGIDARTGKPFAYYETIAGGSGARPCGNGVSGVHTHMTNSLNTPVEALEYAYPFRVRRYSYRPASGGRGVFYGGNGLIREIELLNPATVTLLCDRREYAPWGLNGGESGHRGCATLIRDRDVQELPGRCSVAAEAGDVLRIETPGGGGWGTPA